MAHLIDQSRNQRGAAAFADKPAWHELGTVLTGDLSSKRFYEEAQLNWQADLEPLYRKQLILNDDGTPQEVYVPYTERKLVVRNDSGNILGDVGKEYIPLQNWEAFEFMDGVVGNNSFNKVQYESAGALKDGRIIWLLVRVGDNQAVVPGDEQIPYILLSNAHDGTMSVRCQPTMIRVVCHNTLSMAWREGKRHGKMYEIAHSRLRHTGNLKDRIAEAQKAIGLTVKTFSNYMDTARQMAGTKLTDAKFNEYLTVLFPVQDGEEMSTRQENIMNAIRENYFIDPKQQIAGIERSVWSAFNATTQFFDHQRTVKGKDDQRKQAESRLEGSWFGVAAVKKEEAWQKATELLEAVA